MYKLNQVKLNIYHSDEDLKKKIAKTAGVGVADIDWSTLIILHKSIDARDKNNILFVYNVAFDFMGKNDGVGADIIRPTVGDDILSSHVGASLRALEKYEPVIFNPLVGDDILSSHGRTKCPPLQADDANAIYHQSVGASSTSPNIPRPVVVGFGPAGIFASYILALNGLKPIIVERGKSLDDRTKDVEKFFDTMELNENSNVCFGEGGAGAFSDGKLNTNNKDKTGIYHFILETFVKFGADEKILYENMPHIGTDKLVDVIKNIRNEIIRLGGEVHYNTKLTFENGQAKLVSTVGEDIIFPLGRMVSDPTKGSRCVAPTINKDVPIILAIGNSSRDTFRELMENGFDVKAKPIAIGYRIAHRQSMINEAQYGGSKLGPATYKLTYDVGNGHSVYSFCMCPGGYIINSSNYKGMLSINGMSYNDRSGKYANSAIVETITPEDICGSLNSPVQVMTECGVGADMLSARGTTECRPLQKQALKMIEFQEMIEKKAFELEKGFIPYVTSEGCDICPDEIFKGQAKYSEKLKTVFDNLGLKFSINEDIEKALQHFNKIIPGFFSSSQNSPVQVTTECRPPQTTLPFLIAGVETRTSSPVKLDRDENYMCNVKGFYPCGEGLGHGGGIISCAADGIKVAMKICENLIKSK